MSNIIKLIHGLDLKLIGVLQGSELLPANKINKLVLNRSLHLLDVIISVSKYTDSLIPIKTTNLQKQILIPNNFTF